MSRGIDVGIDLGSDDRVELVVCDVSLARAFYEGVPTARLLARVRLSRDENDFALGEEEGEGKSSFDALVSRILGPSRTAQDRVRRSVARHARSALDEGPLPARDAVAAALVYAVAVSPDSDASLFEAFTEVTEPNIDASAIHEIGDYASAVSTACSVFDTRLGGREPRASFFEACLRLAARDTIGSFSSARLFEASRKLYRSEIAVALLSPSRHGLFPRSLESDLPRRLRRVARLERAELDELISRDPRELAAAIARIEQNAKPDKEPQLRLDSLMADLKHLLESNGTLLIAVAMPDPEEPSPPPSARPSWQPADWSVQESVVALSEALEKGLTTVPRAHAVVLRGGDTALDAVGAEMLRVQEHPFASLAFAEMLARAGRARDVMRLVTYFAVAPDPAGAAKTLAACHAPELPSVLKAWLEAMLPSDGATVPPGSDENTSSAARVTACIASLKPYPTLYRAVVPLLERVSIPP